MLNILILYNNNAKKLLKNFKKKKSFIEKIRKPFVLFLKNEFVNFSEYL